jgi:phosphoribosylformimino-5-aminoimidazole carboxamide ribotide isomerase
MHIIPAIDLRAGRVVRLAQGDYARETVYAADAVELARRYAADGVRWLHVVDLDGARDGTLENLHALDAIARAGLQVQAWLLEFGSERLCIALDTRRADARWTLPVKGWTEASTRDLDDLAPHYARAGVRHLLCTDIARDGMLAGPNLELYAHLRTLAPELEVQASGGVRDMNDLRELRERGAAAAILGRSLLDGTLALREALQC